MVNTSISYYLVNPETFMSTKIATETLEEAIQIVEAEGICLDNLKKFMDKNEKKAWGFP